MINFDFANFTFGFITGFLVLMGAAIWIDSMKHKTRRRQDELIYKAMLQGIRDGLAESRATIKKGPEA